MATRCKKLCAVPGCGQLTHGRWCESHQTNKYVARPYDQLRGSSSARGYDWAWVQVRRVALRRDSYLCQDCLKTDRPTPAKEVHHIIGIDVDPSLRLDLENLVSLCAPCHLKHTIEDQGIWGRKATKKT